MMIVSKIIIYRSNDLKIKYVFKIKMGITGSKCIMNENDISNFNALTEDTWYKIKYDVANKSWGNLDVCANCGDTIDQEYCENNNLCPETVCPETVCPDTVCPNDGITNNFYYTKAYGLALENSYNQNGKDTAPIVSNYVNPRYIESINNEWYVNGNATCVASSDGGKPWATCQENGLGLVCPSETGNAGYGWSIDQMSSVIDAINAGGVHPNCTK